MPETTVDQGADVRLAAYVTPELRDKAEALARKQGRTLSGLIRHMLAVAVDTDENQTRG